MTLHKTKNGTESRILPAVYRVHGESNPKILCPIQNPQTQCGVTHPVKEKLRVVFDCAASYQSRSLNKELSTGPDLINSLVSVLLQFRKEKVPIATDIEAMFYQVKVKTEHQKFLRFFWWPNGNVQGELQEYKMTVHVFGASSSPGCTNFALK